MNSRIFAVGAALVIAGCGGAEMETGTAAPRPEPPDTALLGAEAVRIAGLRTEPVRLAPWHDAWSGPARLTLDPEATQPLGAIVEGLVTQVYALPGERVRAGQVLVSLHSHEMLDALAADAAARAALARADNAVALAVSVAARAERLQSGKALSLAELERARADAVQASALRNAAAAEADRAAAIVEHLTGSGPVPAGTSPHEALVRSPIDGVVVSREVQPGQVVVVGAPLLTVSRVTSLELVLNLPEGAVSAVAPGTEARFTVQAAPEREWVATVTRVAPAIDAVTRTVEVRARVNDPARELRAEMFATARVQGPGSSTVLTVPTAALQTIDGETVVLIAEQRAEGIHVRAAPVVIGRRTAQLVEVLDGVAEGTPVVIEGAAIARAEILRRREAGSDQQ